jgi:two-component system sensor histidine kinase UhpB
MLEDEVLDAELIQHYLRRSGMDFQASITSDKRGFESALLSESFDAVLADNSLPQFNSFEALKLLRSHNLDIPFILVTGTVSEEFAVDIIHKGADDYILKDNLTRLPAAITKAIDRRRIKREKLLTEAALRKSEEEYRLLFDVTPLAAWVVDSETEAFLTVNAAAVKLYGYSHADFRNMRVSDIQQPGAGKIAKHVKKDGTVIDAEIVHTEVSYDNRSASLILINDLTQKLKAEREIRQMNQELRELSSHLQNIREEERIQIARDIHDELGQRLTGMKMEISALSKKTEPGQFDDVLAQIDDLVKCVRRISSNLRPPLLDDFGLAEALKWQSQDVEVRFGIHVVFDADLPEDMDLPVGISTGLFRIYQEALTNAVRHANAHTIRGRLSSGLGAVALEITDDGKGMDVVQSTRKKSFGLLGIKERVYVMNGQYELKSEPGKGTRLSISIPI